MDARLIIDEPGRGSWNMAVDEALLRSVEATGQAVVRFYQWSEPTLSLGYFQQLAGREVHPPSRELSVVRRSTGGGAIVHHHELTYSLACGISDRFSHAPQGFVEQLHLALIATLQTRFGITARLFGENATSRPSNFLCFERRSALDVIVANCKIAGSAQRRYHQVMLQHGSILLRQSPYAKKLLGISELTGFDLSADELGSAFSKQVATSLRFELKTSNLTRSEFDTAEELESTRYGNTIWTNRR